MYSVYVAVKSKKLRNDFCLCIDKSDIAKVTDTFDSLKDCKKKLSACTPDILLLGLDLTDGYWADCCAEIREKYPTVKILAIVSYDEYCIFRHALNNLTSGYISKDALPKVIFSALRAVMKGDFFRYDKIGNPTGMDESDPEKLLSVIRQTANTITNDDSHQDMFEKLTQLMDATEKYRRVQIIKLLNAEKDEQHADYLDRYLTLAIENLLIMGHSNWDIAETLNVSLDTVRMYRMELIQKISGANTMIVNINTDKESIQLGRREQQVLRLIAAGYTYKEIAYKVLNVNIETVNTISDNLRRKFEAESSMIMVIKALRMGLLKLEDIDSLLD